MKFHLNDERRRLEGEKIDWKQTTLTGTFNKSDHDAVQNQQNEHMRMVSDHFFLCTKEFSFLDFE